jgi:hypothetical protein
MGGVGRVNAFKSFDLSDRRRVWGPFAWFWPSRAGYRREKLFHHQEELIEKEKDPKITALEKEKLGKRIKALDQILVNRFPRLEFPTLPTRFGNAIRAFESYPVVVYGADSIPTWLRLTAVMSKQYASATADARAEVDFFLNTFILSAIVAFLATARLLVNAACTISGACHSGSWQHAWFLLGGIAIAWLSYEGAVWRAIAWGELIKSAFDVYLPKLAQTLGYKLPNTKEERRSFWKAFSIMALYFEPMNPALYTPAEADDLKTESAYEVKEQDGEDSAKNER